jgi:hypothetical protein
MPLTLKVEATVGNGRASEDAVDDAGRTDLVGGGGSAETKESCKSERCEADHFE